MARITIVKAFRGQRKCQFTNDSGKCKRALNHSMHEMETDWPKAATRLVEGDFLTAAEVIEGPHEFTQAPLRCGNCGKDIKIGMGYKWVAPRAHRAARGIKKIRCLDCPGWKPSELTSSEVLGIIYSGQEAADDELGNLAAPDIIDDTETVLEELKGIAAQMGEVVTEAAEIRHEAAGAIVDGFGHETSQSEELQDDGDALEDWASDLENISLEDFTESGDGELAEELVDWFDTQLGDVSEVVGNSPL